MHGWSFERKTYTWWSPKSSHSWNLVDFTWNPPTKLINQIFQEKLFSFMECCGKAMSCFHMKSAGFHKICQISCEICRISREIRRISKDQLPGMVSPMFNFVVPFLGSMLILVTQILFCCLRLSTTCSRSSSDMLFMYCELLDLFYISVPSSGLSANLFTKSIVDVFWPGKLDSLLIFEIRKYLYWLEQQIWFHGFNFKKTGSHKGHQQRTKCGYMNEGMSLHPAVDNKF